MHLVYYKIQKRLSSLKAFILKKTLLKQYVYSYFKILLYYTLQFQQIFILNIVYGREHIQSVLITSYLAIALTN
jgi:hypothetical protein